MCCCHASGWPAVDAPLCRPFATRRQKERGRSYEGEQEERERNGSGKGHGDDGGCDADGDIAGRLAIRSTLMKIDREIEWEQQL